MKTRAKSIDSLDLRPVFALMMLCAVAFAPTPASSHTALLEASPSLMAAVAEVPLVLSADSLNLVADQLNEVNVALAGVLSAYVELFSLDTIAQAAAATVAPMPAAVQEPRAGESVALTLAYLPQSLYETAGKTTDFLAAVEMAPLYVITDSLSEALFKAGFY